MSVIFADARALHAAAIEILGFGKDRIAAEVAWGATKRATDGLVLARTGREPTGTGQTTRGLNLLRRIEPALEPLVRQYTSRIVDLHGRCFYSGICGDVNDLIRETADYIRAVEGLAAKGTEAA